MELYKQISDANRIKYGTEAEKILRIIINQYSDRTHFIYEILQNAEDAGATRIQFHLEKEKLVIKHDGRPFNEKDIEGVCGIANGTKEDGTRIGHFGIGFKSVYCYTEHPYIYSGEYHFVIQNQLFPKEVPGSQEIAYDETCMILPFDKGEVPSSIAYQEIRDALTKKITAESIIMLNQISDVRIKIDGYDSAFKPENKIVSEMQVRQDYVDYIYSDQFKNDFERAYNDILEKRNGLVDILIQLQEAMNQEKKTISWTEESRFTIQMKYSVDALNDLLRKKEQDFASAQDKITKAEERRAFLEDRIPASEQFAKSIVQESLPRVNTKIGEYVLEKQQEIEALNKKIQELQEEYARIQGALIIFGKRAKLEKLDADIEEVKAKVIPLQTQLDEQKKILSMRQDGKEDDEILAWMKQVSVYIKKVQDEVRLCSNAKEEYSRFFNELSESDDNIKAAYEGYHRVEAEQYSEEIKKTIQYLYEQLEKYSLVNIYQQIYDESVQVFKEKNGVKSITGKCHRYDLYVQLMFAMKYFNKKIGNMQFICVDEGQDLAVNEYRLLSELNQNHVVFNIFGDTNQLMKSGRGISDWNLLLSELQAEQYVLNENYRNTNQITRFCNDNFGLKTLQTGVDGPKVREISRRDLEKELAGLMITTERIAILLPRTVQKMKYLDMDILPENIRNMIGETMDNGFISVMYVDEVKGIEFDKVFVVSAAMHRNEKYIAYTRALSELIVVVDEKLMNNNSAKKVKENIEHNKKAGIHSATMTGTLKWEKTKQPKAYTLEKTIDNDVITYHFTENTKSIIKNEFANTDSILPSSIASSPLTNIKKNIYAHCVYIENSICYNINCKENMGKKCNKEGNCDYYISLPVPPDEEELIAEDIDNAKKYLAKYS